MATQLSEKIRRIIDLAEAIRNYWDIELPKHHPDYPLIHAWEDSGPSPPEAGQLNAYLKSLDSEDIYKIIMIMYLGREDFEVDQVRDVRDLDPYVDDMKETFDTPSDAISQMISKSPLGEYLADGLAELEKRGIDIDRWGAAAHLNRNG